MAADGVTTVPAGPQQVSRRTVVEASAGELFAIVADPHRHAELDGSGTVQSTVSGPVRLSEGVRFSVGMKQFGVPYRITSTVTEFAQDQVIEWQHPLGHRWRWQFVPQGPDRTQVTETFDYSGSGVRGRMIELFGFPGKNATGIERTLAKLQARYPS
jgi:Polyketide cyclase / dehydrase and lipid transport